jgi:hypothetical protein
MAVGKDDLPSGSGSSHMGWQEMVGLAAGGGLGALLYHGYLKWVQPWLSKLR